MERLNVPTTSLPHTVYFAPAPPGCFLSWGTTTAPSRSIPFPRGCSQRWGRSPQNVRPLLPGGSSLGSKKAKRYLPNPPLHPGLLQPKRFCSHTQQHTAVSN